MRLPCRENIEGKFLALGKCRNVDLVKGVLLQEDHVEEEGLLLDHEVLHGNPLLTWIYSIPTAALHAAPAISTWVRDAIKSPILIGPDSESEQWVTAVARDAGAPFVVLDKTRRGDRDVEVSVPHVDRWRDRTPVLVDDIISTARTMIETVGHLKAAGLAPPVCVGVHAVFADEAYEELQGAGAGQVVTCTTIPHVSNQIDLTELLADGVRSLST